MTFFLLLGLVVVRGVSSGVLHEEILGTIKSSEKVEDIVGILSKCRQGVKHFQHGHDSVQSSFPSCEQSFTQCPSTNLKHIPTHVMMFDQKNFSNDHRICSLLCKRLDNGNLIVLLDLHYATFDVNLKLKDRYDFSLLHASSCILRDCFMGTIFPFELTKWLADKLLELECVTHAVLSNDGDSWVVGDQTSCDTSYKAFLTIVSINAKNISKRVQSIYIRTKTPTTIVKNKNLSVEDCFSIVDNIAISDFQNDINSDLINLLNEKGSSITPSGFFNKITYMFMSCVMESLTDNNIELFTNKRNHEIKMTDGCPCCLSNV